MLSRIKLNRAKIWVVFQNSLKVQLVECHISFIWHVSLLKVIFTWRESWLQSFIYSVFSKIFWTYTVLCSLQVVSGREMKEIWIKYLCWKEFLTKFQVICQKWIIFYSFIHSFIHPVIHLANNCFRHCGRCWGFKVENITFF